MRYGENLFALLDDQNYFGFPYKSLIRPHHERRVVHRHVRADRGPQLVVRAEASRARDGYDPQAGLYLPGSPAAQPFRSLSTVERNPNNYGATPPTPDTTSVEDTLLRGLSATPQTPATPSVQLSQQQPPLEGATTFDRRRLFEARTQADLTSFGGQNSVDYYTRQRLLAKIAKRLQPQQCLLSSGSPSGFQAAATNRTPSIIPTLSRSAPRLTPRSSVAEFFVVDRTLLEDAWNPTAGTYDFRKFVQYRKTIQ